MLQMKIILTLKDMVIYLIGLICHRQDILQQHNTQHLQLTRVI